MSPRKNKNEGKFVSENPDLGVWIRDFAHHLKASPEENIVIYPESFATGYAKVFEIQEGLTFRIVDYVLNSNFRFVRSPSADFFLILYLYRYRNCKQLFLALNEKTIVEAENTDYNNLLMTNSHVNLDLKVTKGTIVQGLTIQISEEWMKKNLSGVSQEKLEVLRKRELIQSIIRPKYGLQLDEIFAKKQDHPAPDLYISTRVLFMLEMFFEDLFKSGLNGSILPKSAKEVQRLVIIEEYLSDHFQEPFPSVEKLSRMIFMSATKLKQSFKDAFGLGLFEYYQKNRMQKAREMLRNEIYSVTEVGKLLGYQNLSNFSIAFKKEFGVLPKDAVELP